MFNDRKERRIAVVDCQLSGISGDMLLGALLSLGANVKRTIGAIESTKDFVDGCDDLSVIVDDVSRHGFLAKRIEIKAEETSKHRLGVELRTALSKCVRNLKLSKEADVFALKSLDTLIKAEATVHGVSLDDVHLHESGSIDTLADIVGTAVALQDLNLFHPSKVYSTPVAVGGGLFKFSHGTVTSPAPATIEILREHNFTIVGGPIKAELTTPTGAALLVNLTQEMVPFYPFIKLNSIGYGAGAKDFKSIPNIVRMILGEDSSDGFLRDKIFMMETNLDDVSGETIGYAINRLLEEGAKDVSVLPMITKKNRPGHVFKVILDEENIEHVSRVLMEETGTLGVRLIPCSRHVLTRESIRVEIEIEGINEKVLVKVAKDTMGNVLQIKPEFESVKVLADRTKKPLRLISSKATEKARKLLSKQKTEKND